MKKRNGARGHGMGMPAGLQRPRSLDEALRMLEDVEQDSVALCYHRYTPSLSDTRLIGLHFVSGSADKIYQQLSRLESHRDWLVAFIEAGGEDPGSNEERQARRKADRAFRGSSRYHAVSEGGLDNPRFRYRTPDSAKTAREALANLAAPEKRTKVALSRIPASADPATPQAAERRYLRQLYSRIQLTQAMYKKWLEEQETTAKLTRFGVMKQVRRACAMVRNATPKTPDEKIVLAWALELLQKDPTLEINHSMIVPLCILVAQTVHPDKLESPADRECYTWATRQADSPNQSYQA